ncbi:hypothetical protein HPY86_05125 [candidate division WOR-3 bacterium]|nr:hypothetical protein [candidate division WOR-3 bacterium]
MTRRILFWVLIGLGTGALVFGSFIGAWARIGYFSSQICLSCMGLV